MLHPHLYVDLERRLAELLGWTDLVLEPDDEDPDAPPLICGTRPDGVRLLVPGWTEDLEELVNLALDHQIGMQAQDGRVMCVWYQKGVGGCHTEPLAVHETRIRALGYCVVRALIRKLEAEK